MSTIITSSALSDRAMSSWPVSIATAMALETLSMGPRPPYDPDRPIPKGIDISRFDSFWINLKTLYRNILGALPTQSQESVMAGDCLYALEYEVETIREIITTISRGRITPTFYSTDYTGLAREHPYANIRTLSTAKQLAYHAQETAVMQEFHKRHDAKEGVHYLKRTIVPLTPTRGILMSHYAYDLLSSKYFDELVLLESHTGVIKDDSLFYTKFYSSKEAVGIPMMPMTLQVFGDTLTFHPYSISDRRELISVAHERKWNHKTTKDRIRLSLELMQNKELSVKLKAMLQEDI